MYGDEIFSMEPPIPKSKQPKIPPPEAMNEPKPKRRYARRSAPEIETKSDPVPMAELCETDDSEALLAAESLFEDSHLLGYYTVSAFIRLFRMVRPEDRAELARIIKGLVSNPRPETTNKKDIALF